MIVALAIEDVLLEAGCVVVGPVGTLSAALALARQEVVDAAVLDINLDGEKSFPVAEELRRRNIPVVFTTGYGESTLPEQWRSLPHICKPFRVEQLVQLLQEVCNR